MQDNQNWLLDILYDRNVLEVQIQNTPFKTIKGNNISQVNTGESTNIYNSVLLILQKIFQKEGNLRFGIGKRNYRNVELIYNDCDIKKNEGQNGNVFRRTMPILDTNPIQKGIENLFKRESLEKALEEKSAFIDKTPEYTKTERAKPVNVPEKWEVNKDEKKNLCDWFCDYGIREDFENFIDVFELIEEILE